MKKWNQHTGRYEEFSPGKRRYPQLPTDLVRQLRNIPATANYGVHYHPCRVVLTDGNAVDCVFMVDAEEYITTWGIWPDQDEGKSEISINDVVRIEASPYRLPVQFAQRLYDAGESGMGYVLFEILYRDGSNSYHVSGNAVDFVGLPPEKTIDDIKEVNPHKGRNAEYQLRSPAYSWCLFSIK